jgi:hypothetical protein
LTNEKYDNKKRLARSISDDSVGTVTRSRSYQARNRGSIPGRGKRFLSHFSDQDWDTPSSVLNVCVCGGGVLSLEVRLPDAKAGHSPSPIVEVKMYVAVLHSPVRFPAVPSS